MRRLLCVSLLLAVVQAWALPQISVRKVYGNVVYTAADKNADETYKVSAINLLNDYFPGTDSLKIPRIVADSLHARSGGRLAVVPGDTLEVLGKLLSDSTWFGGAAHPVSASFSTGMSPGDRVKFPFARIDSLWSGANSPTVSWANGASAGKPWRFGSRVSIDTLSVGSTATPTVIFSSPVSSRLGDAAADNIFVQGTVQDSTRYESGFVHSYDAGDVTVTHAANMLILAGGDFNFQDAVALSLGTGNDSQIEYNGTNTLWNLRAAGSGNLLLNNGLVIVGDGTITTAQNMTIGFRADQGANDNNVLELSSSDVAGNSGGTTWGFDGTDDNVFFSVRKRSATDGGTLLSSYEESTSGVAMHFRAWGGANETTAGTGASSGILMEFTPHNGAGAAANTVAGELVFGIRTQVGGTQRAVFFVDEDGDVIVDGTDLGAGTFDVPEGVGPHKDYLLARAIRAVVNPDLWDQDADIQPFAAALERGGIVIPNRKENGGDGVPFVKLKKGLGFALDMGYTTGKTVYENIIPALGEIGNRLDRLDGQGAEIVDLREVIQHNHYTIKEVIDSLRTDNARLRQRVATLESPTFSAPVGPMIFDRSY